MSWAKTFCRAALHGLLRPRRRLLLRLLESLVLPRAAGRLHLAAARPLLAPLLLGQLLGRLGLHVAPGALPGLRLVAPESTTQVGPELGSEGHASMSPIVVARV